LNNIVFALSSVLVGLSVLTIGGPVLGEALATMAPMYTKDDSAKLPNLGFPVEHITFQTDDGLSLRGWFFPAVNSKAPAILYAPATSRDQRSGLSLVAPFHQAGYHVLLFSYRGHGSSDGDRFGFTYGAAESRDVDAAVRYLREERGIKKIGAIGHSAGAVSIILSAARNPDISAIVAASPFNSVEEIWETNRPSLFPKPLYELTMWLSEFRKGFSRHQVRAMDVIAMIAPRPLLLIHGSADKRITQEQALQLYSQAEQPKRLWVIEGATHHSVRQPGLDVLAQQILQFFDRAFQNQVNTLTD
jgi:dipeptidyl aminopeptidase/acylaminoacyl peptidase